MLAKKSAHLIILAFILAFVSYWLGDKCGCIILYSMAGFFVLSGVVLLIFFRDPHRDISDGICCVADGKIRAVSDDGQHLFISTFMNVHNVHVNRAPIDGRIVKIRRIKGGLKPAYDPLAHKNQRVETTMQTSIGEVKIVQIAGVFAYRICPYIKEGQRVKRGEKIGIIRFGSRVDVYLPSGKVETDLKVGDVVFAGTTRLARVECLGPGRNPTDISEGGH